MDNSSLLMLILKQKKKERNRKNGRDGFFIIGNILSLPSLLARGGTIINNIIIPRARMGSDSEAMRGRGIIVLVKSN